MATAVFGKPESAGVVIGCDPTLIDHANVIYRAIHTLNCLRDWGIVKNDDSTASLFAMQSHAELSELLDWYKAQGVRAADLDLGSC